MKIILYVKLSAVTFASEVIEALKDALVEDWRVALEHCQAER